MTIRGLVLALQEKGVRVFTCREARAPLHRILSEPVTAIEEVRLGILGRPEAGEGGESFLEMAPMRIRGLPPGARDRPGLLVAHHENEAAAFLLDRFEPSGSGEMDTLIREARARKGSKYSRIEWLLDRLVRTDSDDEDDAPFFVRQRRRRRRGRSIRTIWMFDDFKRHFRGLSAATPRVFLPVAERDFRHQRPDWCVVVERTRFIGRHRVPQWDWMVADCSDESSPILRGWFEGHPFEFRARQADLRMAEAFDKDGRLVQVVDGDFFYGEVLTPRFLVRVPARLSRRASRGEGALPSVARGLSAAYLLDSRCPQGLADDLPVVDRADEAWAILMRTTGGVFLPDADPVAPPDTIRRMSGAFFVASVPDLRLERARP